MKSGAPPRATVRPAVRVAQGVYTRAVAAVVVAALYPACLWFARLKQRRRDWWLGYL